MSGTELDRLVLREVCRGEEAVRKAVLHVDRMLRRRGYGPLEPRFPEKSKLSAFSVHSCYLARRVENRSRAAATETIDDPKLRKRVEIALSVEELGSSIDLCASPGTPANRETDSICVLACALDVKPGVVELKGFHEIVQELEATRGLVLVQDKMTTPAKKSQKASHAATPLEVFRYSELFFDRVRCQVWPKCVPLDGRAALFELYLHFERFHEDDSNANNLLKAATLLRHDLQTDPDLERRLLERKRKELKRYFSSDPVSRYFGAEEDDLLLVRTCNYGEEPKVELRVVCKPVQTTVSKASSA